MKYYEEFCLLRYNTAYSIESQPTFRNNMSSPTSGLENKQQGTDTKHVKEATCSTETSAEFQRTTRRYIPRDRALHNHRCENLKSYAKYFTAPKIWIL
jgi:hypothetical protein